MVVVLGEESTRKTSLNAQEMQAVLEAARLYGCRVYPIPPDFTVCETAENALAYLPTFEAPILGVWVGYIPTIDRYSAIYDAALDKGVRLINSPEQHQTAMEFDRFYPLLHDITPKSVIVESLTELPSVTTQLKFPVFVKGAVKSNKEQGLNAVVAKDMTELETLAQSALVHSYRSRGKVIVRDLVALRRVDETPQGFPISREYRIFIYKQEIVAYGFYWDEFDDSQPLTGQERQTMFNLAIEAARRTQVPFLAVDVGQLESGEWIIIEIGDAQFCGLSQIPVLELWSKIKDFE
jgi:hypothetical protein